MQALLLIYNVLLIILYCFPLILAFLIYTKNRSSIYLYIALLFGAFVLDEVVIYMTEFIHWFSVFYKRIMFAAPTFKTIIYFLSFLCMIKIVEWILDYSLPISLYIGLVGLILFLLFIPGMNDSSLKLWLYYTASSVFSIVIGLHGLYHYKKIPKEKRSNLQKHFHYVLIMLVVFYIAVTLEDYFTLFNPNSLLYRNTRSISEDIFRITLTIIVIIYLMKRIYAMLGNETAVHNDQPLASSATPFADNIAAKNSASEDDSFSKFYLFCKEYHLTTREQDIMLLLLDNKSNNDISESLVISLGTAKTHVHNIYAKLDVKKRRELLQLYDEFQVKED